MYTRERLQSIAHKDALVADVLRMGGGAIAVIEAMDRRHTVLSEKILELTMIAPFKITQPDGKVLIWRCPEELVPDRTPAALQSPDDSEDRG